MGTINTFLVALRKSCTRVFLFFSFFWFLILLGGCVDKPEPYEPTPFSLEIPSFFPTYLNIPEDNPLTVEGIALGRRLFYDTRVCGYTGLDPDSMMSCATCHKQEKNFRIGTDDPRFPGGDAYGLTGQYTHHAVMPLVNLVFNHEGYFWNGSVYKNNPNVNARNIEDIVLMAILAPDEMNSTAAKTIAALQTDSNYPEMFEKAFGTPEITMDRIKKAIAQFIRTLVSGNSKFDRYLKGLETLTPDEMQGYILFSTEEGADCFHCHGGAGTPLFTTNLFYNNGRTDVFNDPMDRFSVTGNDWDHGAYRAPSLRNVMVSGPYMHDGHFKTIDEVLEFYNAGLVYSPYISPLMHKIDQGGMMLTPIQINQLKAFLHTLTDEEFLTNPKHSKP